MSETQKPINRGTFMRAVVDMGSRAAIRALIPERPASEAENRLLLDQWLAKVAPVKDDFLAKLEASGKSPSQLVGKGLSKEAFRERLDMYLPIYLAAQEKYKIRPAVFVILHARETVFSKANYGDGAMQINSSFYGNDWRDEALKDWEFLKLLKTRQPTDAREIMAAGKYLTGRWGKRVRTGEWDVLAMDTYGSIEDGPRMSMARRMIAITG